MASSDVVLSAALRNNLLSLQGTQRLIDTVQLRLATGLKVNSALDGPSQFFTSQSLSNRAGDLTRLLDGINLSIRAIEEADRGVTALTNLVEQAQSVAQEAQSEIRSAEGFASITATTNVGQFDDLTTDSGGAIVNGDDIRFTFQHADVNSGTAINVDINIATGDTIYDIVGTINSTTAIAPYLKASVDSAGRLKVESLREGGLIRIGDVPAATSLGADGYAFLGLQDAVTTENTLATTRQAGTIVAGRVLTSQVAATGSQVNGEYVASATLVTGGVGAGYLNAYAIGGADDLVISIRVDDQTVSLGDFTDATTIQQFVDRINTSSVSDLVEARFNTTTGRIEIEFADSVGQAEITYTSEAAGTTDFGFGTQIADSALTAAQANSEAYTFVGSSANLAQFRDDYNNIRDQIDSLVEDANFRGVNLLGGDDLTTFFNEDRSNSLITEGADFTASGLGLGEVSFLTGLDVQDAIDETQTALDAIRNFGQSISNSLSIIQTRRDFTEGTISTLKAGAGDLVNADQNEEGANLLALQTRQQLGVTALSLAAQSQQSVLRLF